MTRLFCRADHGMTEEKKVQFLMRGVKELFGSLVRQPPTTVKEFMQEACTIENTLDVRARQYNRPSSACAIRSDTPATPSDSLREVICEIVREELSRLLPSFPQPQAATLMDVVREEVQQALGTPTATEPQAMTYAAAVRLPSPNDNPYVLLEMSHLFHNAASQPPPAQPMADAQAPGNATPGGLPTTGRCASIAVRLAIFFVTARTDLPVFEDLP
ncbi:hypothetical protein V5799_027642 [Amblyomma americanum]|uniref:Uncharacterized protein n=1 Tax=Amblyomma americanum TaxID=6943 RepID=A0AAQ4DF50_AMBAM